MTEQQIIDDIDSERHPWVCIALVIVNVLLIAVAMRVCA